MKNLALAVLLFLGFAFAADAQVRVEVVMDQDQFVANESIPVKVRIINSSGKTLHFGSEHWLDYSVEAKNGSIVMKDADAPIAHDFEIKSAETGTARADLGPCFQIFRPGRYVVTVTVHLQDWGRDVTASSKPFEVVSGVRLWDQEIGVPQTSSGSGAPEVRKFILQQATLSRQMKLYFRLVDQGETRTFRVFSLGPMISFSNPQTRVDSASNLHLLYQSGAHVYSYSIINPDGELTTRQTYYYGGSAPRLTVTDEGNVTITGGMRHLAENDLPASRKSILTNDIPLPVP